MIGRSGADASSSSGDKDQSVGVIDRTAIKHILVVVRVFDSADMLFGLCLRMRAEEHRQNCDVFRQTVGPIQFILENKSAIYSA